MNSTELVKKKDLFTNVRDKLDTDSHGKKTMIY